MRAPILLADCQLPNGTLADLLIEGGRIAAIDGSGAVTSPAADRIDAHGRLVTPGLTDPHLHPDKAFGLDDEEASAASLQEAIARVRARKPFETAEAIRERSNRLLRWCLSFGTTRVRVHAEVDPYLQLRSVAGVLAAKADLAGLMKVQVVAFPQEGIAREPGTLALLREALVMGCDVVGAISYQDADAREHLAAAAGLAREFDRPLDVHADFGIAPAKSALCLLADITRELGLEGRVTAGHCTTLAKFDSADRDRVTARLREAAITVVALPRTDVFLDGVIAPLELLRAQGVRCAIGTNNVRNSFTPVGRPSLPSAAALYALVRRQSTKESLAASAIGLWEAGAICGDEAAIAVGAPADICLWPVKEPWQIVATEAEPDLVFSAGRLVSGRQAG